MIAKYFLWVAYVDRCYGGPEEGGWYYDTGEPVRPGQEESPIDLVQVFDNKEEARAAYDALQPIVSEANIGRRSPNSVLSCGDYLQVMLTTRLPQQWPETIPRYE